MTTEQKNRITSMRKAGYGYTAVARELGLSKSAVGQFCRENGLGNIVVEKGPKDLQSATHRGKLCDEKTAGNLGNKGLKACRVTTIFADEPNEQAVTEALRILANA